MQVVVHPAVAGVVALVEEVVQTSVISQVKRFGSLGGKAGYLSYFA